MDIKLVCEQCGAEFYRRKGEVNRSKKLGRRNFCTQSCQITYCNSKCRTKESFSLCGENIKQYSSNKLDDFSPFRSHLKQARWHSKNKSREVNITLEDLKSQWEKQIGICPYTGWIMINSPNTNTRVDKTPNRASLDRIDSSKGYTKDNIQFISMMAQFAKNGWDEQELITFCKAVAENHV